MLDFQKNLGEERRNHQFCTVCRVDIAQFLQIVHTKWYFFDKYAMLSTKKMMYFCCAISRQDVRTFSANFSEAFWMYQQIMQFSRVIKYMYAGFMVKVTIPTKASISLIPNPIKCITLLHPPLRTISTSHGIKCQISLKKDQNRREYPFAAPPICREILKTCTIWKSFCSVLCL